MNNQDIKNLLPARDIMMRVQAYIARCQEVQALIHKNTKSGYHQPQLEVTANYQLGQLLEQISQLANLMPAQEGVSVVYENPVALSSLNEAFAYVTQPQFADKLGTDKNFSGRHLTALELLNQVLSREIALIKAEIALASLKTVRSEARNLLQKARTTLVKRAVLKASTEELGDALTAKVVDFQQGRHYSIDYVDKRSMYLANRGISTHFTIEEAHQAFEFVEMTLVAAL